MTTDDTLVDLALDLRRIHVSGASPRDVRTIADALGVVIERLAETRRLVDALAGPMRIEHGKMRFYVNGREVEGVERGGGMIEIPLEPADVASDELRVEPAPRPTDDSPEAWRASIRAALPPTQVFAFDRHDFVECYPCACKPGMPTLCAHCLANRATISALRAALREVIDDAAGLFTGMRSGVWQKPSDSKLDSKLARLAELRRLL